MSYNERCPADERIKQLAADALRRVERLEKEAPKSLELDLKKVEEDLNAIIMDNHNPK